MAADEQSLDLFDFQSINPDNLEPEEQSRQREESSKFVKRLTTTLLNLNFSISQLPGMLKNCTNRDDDFPTSVLNNPDPVELPECKFYPIQPDNQSRLFCCREYSKTPIQFLLKSVIELVYHTILDTDFTFKELHIEVHKKLHRAVDAMHKILEETGLGKLFERVALTLADKKTTDIAIDYGLNALTNSFSNAASEYMLSESLLTDDFSFKETENSVQYSAIQPVTSYFLRLIQEHSSVTPECRIILEAIPGTDSFFMIRSGLKNNRAYLPLVFCLGMLVGCPFASRISSQNWLFSKEVLYMLAKVFSILDINMSGFLYSLLSEDICRCGKRQTLYCRPLWRALISIERTPKEPECISHIPRTSATMVELSRIAEIVARSETWVEYEKEDVEKERQRVLNTYETREKQPVRDEWITAVLMYERNQLCEQLPQFIPKLKWIHKRIRSVRWNVEDTSERL